MKPPVTTPAHQGIWSIESSTTLDSDDLAEHVHFLAKFIEAHRAGISALRNEGFAVRARIFWELGDEVLSTSLDPQDLATIAACVDGLDLSVV